MSGHTATPWKVDGEGKRALVRGADFTIVANRHMLPAEVHAANAAFIVEACNSHADLIKVLAIVRELVAAYDSGNLQMRTPEIGEPENGIPYHEWHEEWLHNAHAALATLTARKVG